jgi:hypothetical protein
MTVDLQRLEAPLRRANAWLVGVNIGFSVVIFGYFLYRFAFPVSETIRAANFEQAKPIVASYTPLRWDEVTQVTTGKSVFRTHRVRQVKVVDELAHYRPIGISRRQGETRAYVRDEKLRKLLIKQEGEFLGSYEIMAISQEGIVVRRGSEELLLRKN